ncbi:MAG: magnesium chelatase subunit H [Gemmatimonadales bacterium]|nr:magnesium chelatase subunit H [Gemmatimonadales bacterium]
MRSDRRGTVPIRVVIVTLDAHFAGAFERARAQLARELPGLDLQMHLHAEFDRDAAAAERARTAIRQADVLLCGQLFTEEQAAPVLEALRERAPHCDAVFCALSTPEVMRLLRLGKFSMAQKEEEGGFSLLGMLRKLRGRREDGKSSGERQMTMVRQLPKLLRFIPGTAQDVRVWFLGMQYWLAGSDVNLANLVKALVDRYADGPRRALRGTLTVAPPEEYPEVGCWHPALPGRGMTESVRALPAKGTAGRVGLLVGRSYLLAGNTRHYEAVVAALEARGLAVVPAFASGLDARPAIERFHMADGRTTIDALVSLTGFSLVGGPAYNDAEAAQAVLRRLDVPYFSLQSLEFQGIDEWRDDPRGLSPLQATLQVAIPELDGAIGPVVYGGKGRASAEQPVPASEPIAERIATIADRVRKMVALRRKPVHERKVAIVLFNFPPNAGNTGSAAYLAVLPSLQRVLAGMKERGYTVTLPDGAEDIKAKVCDGNRERLGAPANVFTRLDVDDHVRREPHLADIEATWGPAPGRQLTDGRSLFIMGEQFGNVFVGVQPAFGWEGDPMRLLFEGNFAPTHAFSAFYRWLREEWGADAVLHFGTHGALEFMPGKQVGLSGACWPERLIGDLPNVYLYASNNSSEGTLAKRRGGATLVSYLTPPIANAGLYKGLAELKASLDRYRQAAPGVERAQLAALVQAQASALDLEPAEPAWDGEAEDAVARVRTKLLELEYSLIPVGLHVVGDVLAPAERVDTLCAIGRAGRPDLDVASLAEALGVPAAEAGGEAGDAVARAVVTALVETGSVRAALAAVPAPHRPLEAATTILEALLACDRGLATDHEVPGVLHALDAGYVAPAPGGDLVRSPAVVPTGRNLYGFDPYKVPSAYAQLEGRRRADQLLQRHVQDGHPFPETVAFVLWGTDNMKSEGTPLAQCLALMGAVPRFDAVGRLAGARLVPLEQLGRPRVDVVVTLSGIFRDLLPLQVRLLAEAALLAAQADEPEERNFVRKHALAQVRETGCDLATAALRVFSNADGAYGSNVNLLVESGRWEDEDELADQFVARKGFAYGAKGAVTAAPQLMRRLLGTAELSFQNIDSVELGATDIDQYVESLGGMNRVITQQRGAPAAVYMGDHTGAEGKVRTLQEQVEFETRTRMLNPKWFEGQLRQGYEGARNIAGHVTTTFGWSATAGAVPQWVYQQVTETYVLDEVMRRRLAEANPQAAVAVAQRLLEANDRGYWRPDDATLEALRAASAELEDRLEGVFA